MKKIIIASILTLCYVFAFSQNMPGYWVPVSGTNTYTTNITGFTAGYTYKVAWVSFTNGNTGASTIVIGPNNVSAAPIRKWDGDSWEALVSGDIPTITGGARAILTYNNTGSFFELNLLSDNGSNITASNGITKTGNNLTWGGALTGNTTIDGNTFNINLGSSTGDRMGNLRAWSNGTVRLDGTTAAGLQSEGDVDLTSDTHGILKIGATGHILTDNNATKKGLQTAATGYVTDPRSYTDKEYVDAADALKTNLIWPDNVQTTSYTGVLTDINKVIQMNSASALNFTVPPNSSVAYPIGTYLVVRQKGAGTVTIVEGAGVAITEPAGGTMDTPGQGLSVTLHKTGTDTWDLENGSAGGGGSSAWGGITGTLSDQTDLQSALNLKAPLASPALTGTPTVPTASANTNNTQAASTAYADAKVTDAITDAVTTVAPSQNAVFDALALKANLISPTFTTPNLGTPSAVVLTNATGLPAASETFQGAAEIATQAETNTGTDDARIVTPLKRKVANAVRSSKTASYTLASTDDQTEIIFNSASDAVLTIGTQADGFMAAITNIGVGSISFLGSGVTISGASSLAGGSVMGAYIRFTSTTTAYIISAGAVSWNQISSKPTTISGYAITDGVSALNAQYTTVGNVGTGEDVLHTYTVGGGTLSANGQSISAYSAGTFATSVNSKRLRVKFGATTIFDSGALAITTTADWTIRIEIIRTGTTTQRCTVALTTSSGTLSAYSDYSTASETMSSSSVLQITGEATADNDITEEMFKVKKEGI